MLHITYVFADTPQELNTSNFFAFTPSRAINRSGKAVCYSIYIGDFGTNTPNANELLEKSDIILVERNYREDVIKQIEYWKAKGKLVLGWFDDGYHLMRNTNSSYPYWIEGRAISYSMDGKIQSETLINPKPLVTFKEALGKFHGYLCPSKYLMNEFKDYGKGYYFPNLFPARNYLSLPPKERNSDVLIGWGGSLSHYQSFEESNIIPALRRVLEKRNNVKLLIAGDHRVYDLIKIPENKKMFQGYVPAEKWPETVNKFDIGLAPLSGMYDRCRSHIKIAEYMMLKIPFIASDNVSYDDLKWVQSGKIVKNTTKNWETALNDMLDNLGKYVTIAYNEPYEYAVKEFDVNNKVDFILNFYREIAKENNIVLEKK